MAKHERSLDRLFHALADPTRRGIVERLVEGPATVTTLADPTGMALPTVMRHIEVLAEAGLVTTEKAGRTRLCRADPARLAEARSWMDAQRQAWEARLDRLEAHVARPKEHTDDE